MSTTIERTAVPATREPVKRLYDALRHTSAAERRLRTSSHGPGDLTFPQVRALAALAALAREEQLSAGELARSAELRPATVTSLLDQLEDAGILRRTRSTEDRRVYMISLTDAGRELVERRYRAWQEHYNRRLSGISDEDLETAARVLDEVAALYDAAPRELTDGA
jgi:MarR family transcriptional regulator, organic hydroperoxide resistance regulator